MAMCFKQLHSLHFHFVTAFRFSQRTFTLFQLHSFQPFSTPHSNSLTLATSQSYTLLSWVEPLQNLLLHWLWWLRKFTKAPQLPCKAHPCESPTSVCQCQALGTCFYQPHNHLFAFIFLFLQSHFNAAIGKCFFFFSFLFQTRKWKFSFSSIVQREAKICSLQSARSSLRFTSLAVGFYKKIFPCFFLATASQIWQETGSIFLAKNLAFLTYAAF